MEFWEIELLIIALYLPICCRYRFTLNPYTITRWQYRLDQWYLVLVMLFLGCTVCLRGNDIGNDTITYVQSFQHLSYSDYDSSKSRFEIGYLILCKFAWRAWSTPHSIILFTGLITSVLYYIFIRKYSKWYFLSLMLFFLLNYFDGSMNIIRGSVAASILTFSYRYLTEKMLIPFILTVLLAMSFHESAFIFFLAWPCLYLKLNSRTYLLIVFVTVVCSVFFELLLGATKYESYENSIYGEGQKLGTYFKIGISGGLLYLTLLVRSIVGKKRFRNANLELPLIFMIVNFCFLVLSIKMNIVSRMGLYFGIFQIIAIPNAILLLPSGKRRLWIIIGVLFFANLSYWAIQIYRPQWNLCYPYHMFFKLSV